MRKEPYVHPSPSLLQLPSILPSRYSFIYDAHLLGELLKQLFLWTLFFTILFLLSVFLEKLEIFINHKSGIGPILAYLGHQAPFWCWKALPLAFLGASLTVLDNANRTGELTALEGLGIPLRRSCAPVLALGAILAAAGFAGLESKSPLYYRESKTYLKTHIQKKTGSIKPLNRFTAKGTQGRYFTFGLFYPKENRFEDFWMDEWAGERHEREVFAKRGHYDADRNLWVLEEAAERVYFGLAAPESAAAPSGLKMHRRLLLQTAEAPSQLLPSAWKIDEMTLEEIEENLRLQRERGLAHRELLTERQSRAHWPWSFLVMGFAAVTAIEVLPRKLFRGKLVLFGLTITAGLTYWFAVSLSRTLALHGLADPDTAAWLTHGAFGLVCAMARLLKLL